MPYERRITLEGRGSKIDVVLENPIYLNNAPFYEIGLAALFTSNSIRNVTNKNNNFAIYLNNQKIILSVAEGIYEFEDLVAKIEGLLTVKNIRLFLQEYIPKLSFFISNVNNKPTIHSPFDIDFNVSNSIAPSLGYSLDVYNKYSNHESQLDKITNVSVTETNNQIGIKIKNDETIVFKIAEGTYTFSEIGDLVHEAIINNFPIREDVAEHDDDSKLISISYQKTYLRCEITSNLDIDFNVSNSIADLLGFSRKKYEANNRHISEGVIKINNVNAIRVCCNLVLGSGSYLNNKQTHSLYNFKPLVPAGYPIVVQPSTMSFLPINTTVIQHISIVLEDQFQHPIDLQNEDLTVELIIRPVQYNTRI